jgi:hypothetical protein
MENIERAPGEWLKVNEELKDGSRRVTLQHLIQPLFMIEVTGSKAEFVSGVSDAVLRLPGRVQRRWKENAIAQVKRGSN